MADLPAKWEGYYPGDTVTHDDYGRGWLEEVHDDGTCLVHFFDAAKSTRTVRFEDIWRSA